MKCNFKKHAGRMAISMILVHAASLSAQDDFEFEVLDAGSEQPAGNMDVLMEDHANHTRVERGLVVPAPRTTRKGTLSYLIEHRNRIPVDDEPFDNFLGFDGGGLKVGLGLYYGLTDNADIGLYRLNGTSESFDTYQFTCRIRWLSEKTAAFDSAILAGTSLFTVPDEDDDWGVFLGGLFGKSLTDKIYCSLGLLHHANSTAEGKTANDEEGSSAMLGSFHYRLSDRLFLVGDFSQPFEGYESVSGLWAAGLKYVTHGHSFSFIGSNSQYMGLDGLAAGTSKKDDDVLLGFAITRELR